VPAAALVFVPMILAAYYGRPVMSFTSSVMARLPRTRFGPLNSVLNTASLAPRTMAAVLHGVLVGPVAPTEAQRRAIMAPVLVLGHRNDFIHPFNDARGLVAQLPHGELVQAHSLLELRLRPERLTEEIAGFLSGIGAPSRQRPRRTA
jgi:pimeloyl-ACP methyl ester carboxylesterase